MGQAKQNRTRLGSWYGKPVVAGHPDFVAKVKKPAAQPVPIPIDRAVEEVFARELKSEIDGAKATVKKMIDEQVMTVLAKTLKQALGLER